MNLPFFKIMKLFVNGNKKSGVMAVAKMMKKNAAWLEAHPQYKAVSWDFNFDEKKHQDGFYYHFTQCPINAFARREGCLDVLPVICDLDHMTAKLMQMKLFREQTLASGGKMCDYWMVGDKIQNPK